MHNNVQSLSISHTKTGGFTAQGSVNKRLNQIELQKMKGKHEWGNEGADVVSDQITISTDYWRGKRLIELFYHTESLRLVSPRTKPIPLPPPHWLSWWGFEKLFWGVTVFSLGVHVLCFICQDSECVNRCSMTAVCHMTAAGGRSFVTASDTSEYTIWCHFVCFYQVKNQLIEF